MMLRRRADHVCPLPDYPLPIHAMARLAQTLTHKAAQLISGPGLTQFKSTFGPTREPLYALAPNWPAMALGLADLTLSIHASSTNPPHHLYEEKAFANGLQT